jgi:hypothetical protein
VPDDTRRVLDLTLDLRSYTDNGEQHAHDYHQLILPVEWRLELVLDSTAGAVEAGSAALVTANSLHHFRASGPNRFIVA